MLIGLHFQEHHWFGAGKGLFLNYCTATLIFGAQFRALLGVACCFDDQRGEMVFVRYHCMSSGRYPECSCQGRNEQAG